MLIDRRSFIAAGASMGAVMSLAPAAAASTLLPKAAVKRLASYMDQHRKDWGLPGITLAMATPGGVAVLTSGLADVGRKIAVNEDHLFHIGSISKMMAGLTVWSLVDEGKLAPDARLADVLPGLKVRGGEAITLQHLLNHVSGLPGNAPIAPDGGLWIGPAPGAHWSYSNTGFDIIGKVVEAIDGRSYPDSVEARVLGPLGMTASRGGIYLEDRERHAQGYTPARWDWISPRPCPMREADWVDSDSAAGCITATPGDMGKFLQFLMGLNTGDGGAVLSGESARRFLETASPAPGWAADALYGNGIAHVTVDERKYLHHTGGMVSFSSALYVDREAEVAAFASANVHYGLGYRPRDVALYACELLRAERQGAAAPAPKPTAPKVENAAQYAGVFTAEDGATIEVIADGEKLFTGAGGTRRELQQASGKLFSSADDRFRETGLVFDMEGEEDASRAVRIWAGETEYLRDPAAGYSPPAPADLKALAGRYDNDDRWWAPVTIYARDGKLWVGNIEPLKQTGDGAWRPAEDEQTAERMTFGLMLGGKAQKLTYSGVDFYRRFG